MFAIITHLEKALEYGQDAGVPIEILDKIDDAIAMVEFEIDEDDEDDYEV